MDLVRAQLERQAPSDLPGYKAGTISVRGGDLAYEVAGQGEPIVLLHGHSFDRRMWDPQFAELAKHYRVIRYDLRGYGLSDLPAEGVGSLHADDLAALLDALKIQKAHVVGLSLGGYVVGDMVALYPDRLLSATSASGGVFDGPASRNLSPQEWEDRLKEIEAVRAKGVESAKNGWMEALLKGTGHHEAKIRPLLSKMIGEWSAWQFLHIEPRLVLGHEAIDKIAAKKPDLPVLWIAGANDHYQESLAKFQQVLPQSEVVVIPDAGHLSNLEQPEAFTAALLKFLKAHQAKTEKSQ
jgi:pimeloyl-ACP methyl ester carboxylesterase